MIRVYVQTIWQGKVGVRDRYVRRALKNHEGLVIAHEKEYMVIPYSKIRESISGYSRKSFDDFYSSSAHKLVYFKWRPSEKQRRLALK